jgi:hypothetical protein
MKRRDFIRCLGSLALSIGTSGARGQTSSKVFRVGTLSPGTPMTESVYGPALVRGLAQQALSQVLAEDRKIPEQHVAAYATSCSN